MTVTGMYHTETVEIDASADEVYALVSDITRMGEWSLENVGGDWLGGATGAVGDRFEGHNKIGDREWSVICHVTKAEPGSEFQFVTGDPDAPYVRWSYRLAGSSPTTVTEVWDVEQLPPTLVDAGPERLASRADAVRAGMAQTLAGIKATAER
ncbi:MAG: SRPBCC family protein [Acidimicrobiia bacterium]|nr:SRPBCC family protein [Acidimicrobiia bacterium]